MNNETLQKILVGGAYVSQEDFDLAVKWSKANRKKPIDYLFTEELISKDIFGQAIAEYFKIPYTDLNTIAPSKEVVLKIPESIAIPNRLVFAQESANSVTITTDTPENPKIKEALASLLLKKKILLTYSLTEDIDSLFSYYKKGLDTRFAKIIADNKKIAPEIIEQIIDDAVVLKASDIHFEPEEKNIVIRFRIDGVLSDVGLFEKIYYENILNRIKVDARLRIDEHMKTQDGSIRYFYKGKDPIDVRISIAPTIQGEKVVLRLLSHYVEQLSVVDLGLSPAHQDIIEKTSLKPFGMIVIAGPTGAGKSTTLYAVLKKLNQRNINITTIEDPVEYRIAGVNQIQVNTVTNLTFSTGLRSIVRQDPDVILVGEVRDKETAEIAVNAALTGHLLLTTFHANDASSALPRMLDMGVQPFLLSSTVELVVAQRLVRKICNACRVSEEIKTPALEKKYPGIKKYIPLKQKSLTLYKGKGCAQCHMSGFLGRVGVFECIVVSESIRNLTMKQGTSQDIWNQAKKEGATSLFEDGLEKVLSGITTLEEVIRVTGLPRV